MGLYLSTLNPATRSILRFRKSFNMFMFFVIKYVVIPIILIVWLLMQHQEIKSLLLDIKNFLTKHIQLHGAFQLLARLDAQLYKNDLEQSSLVSWSIRPNANVQLGDKNAISPRKFVNIYDIFVLQYSFVKEKYEIIEFSPPKSAQQTSQRNGILELITSRNHKKQLKQIRKTSSMTEIHSLTSNVPKNNPCLVLPNYINNQMVKYFYIYETKQCLEHQGSYFLADRYYCFIADGFADIGINEVFCQLKKRIFEERIKNANPQHVQSAYIKNKLIDSIPLLIDRINLNPIYLNEVSIRPWLQKQQQYHIHSVKAKVITSLPILYTFLVISEFKVIFLCSNEDKSRLSDVVLYMQQSINPMKYTYPIVFCTLTKNHCDFIESPVPLTVGFWGSENRRSSFVQNLANYFKALKKQPSSMPTVVINLLENKILMDNGIKMNDVYTIEKLNNFLKKYGKGKSLWEKTSRFLRQMVEQMGEGRKQKKSEWMNNLNEKMIGSQLYQIYKSL